MKLNPFEEEDRAERDRRVVASHQAGKSKQEIARQEGLSVSYVHTLLYRAGAIIPKTDKEKEERALAIHMGRQEGLSLAALGRRFGLDARAIRYILGRYGYPVHLVRPGTAEAPPPLPQTYTQAERNTWIIASHEAGVMTAEIAAQLGITPRRVNHILARHFQGLGRPKEARGLSSGRALAQDRAYMAEIGRVGGHKRAATPGAMQEMARRSVETRRARAAERAAQKATSSTV